MRVERYRAVARTIEQLANDYIKEQFPLGADCVPNIQIVANAINAADVSNPALRLGGPIIRSIVRGIVTGRDVDEPAVRLQILNTNGTARYQLCENLKYRDALNTAFRAHGKAQYQGPEGMIIRAAIERNIALDDAQSLTDIVAEFYDQLPNTPEHNDAVRAANLKQQMIDYITKNGTSGFSLTNEYGTNKRQFDKDGFQIEFSSSGGRGPKGTSSFDDETSLRNAYNQVLAKRQAIELYNQGKLGQHVDQQAKQRYENRFHADPTTGAPVTRRAKQLIDPRNGLPFASKAQLVSFINSSRSATAQLLQRNGKVDPELGREFERILNGK